MTKQELRQMVKEELARFNKPTKKTRKNESSMGTKYDTIVDTYSGMKFVFNRGTSIRHK